MSGYKIAVLAGDGIGPEVMDGALKCLAKVGEIFNHSFNCIPALVGGAAYEEFGEHCPTKTLELCSSSDGVLFGSVGGPVSESHLPKWKGCETNSILALRKALKLSANLRPVRIYPQLIAASPLRAEIAIKGVDLVIVRELQGDVYFGEHKFFSQVGDDGLPIRAASDTAEYTSTQITAVSEVAFKAARLRKNSVTSVDKANVLHTSKLWREVVHEVHKERFNDVVLADMLVDNCALQLVKNPSQFDVILTSNLFGDILSDLAAALPGSLGLCPSASLPLTGPGLFEPSGGSAPEIAGKGIANPIAQILSAGMMLRFGLGLENEACAIERAVEEALAFGLRTSDIALESEKVLSTNDMANAICERIRVR